MRKGLMAVTPRKAAMTAAQKRRPAVPRASKMSGGPCMLVEAAQAFAVATRPPPAILGMDRGWNPA